MLRLLNQNFVLIQESGKSGLVFEIVIIREGASKNGTFYPKETLLKSRPLFEGAKAAFYQWNNIYDHLSEQAKMQMPHGFPSQVAGFITDVKFRKLDDGSHALTGMLNLSESSKNLADLFRLSLEKKITDALGFSIDVYGESEKRQVEGIEVDYITDISSVNEVTVVTNPAAGGRLERMVASYSVKKEKEQMKNILLRFIAAINHNKLKGLNITESDDASLLKLAEDAVKEVSDRVKENSDVMAALKEAIVAMKAGDTAKATNLIESAITAYETYMTESTKSKETETASDESDAKKETVVKESEKKKTDATVTNIKILEDRLLESEKRDCMSDLKVALADSKLPKASHERIVEGFKGKVFSSEDSKKVIDSERKYLSTLTESLHPNGLSLEVGQDSSDKIGDAIEGMIADKDINKIPRFRSFTEAFSKTEGERDVFRKGFKESVWRSVLTGARSLTEKKTFQEAVTLAGFGEILGDRLHKRMVAEYNEIGLDDWRKIATVSSVSDFLTNRAVRMGGYGTNMPTVAEGGAYTSLTTPTDEEATYTVTKKGGLETLSWESIKSDNLKALQMIPKRLGRGAKNTLYQFVFELINPATNPAIYDAVTLYHATHGANLRTAALSWTEFDAITLVMNDQAGYNEANFFVMNQPKYIVVPNELRRTAFEIANAGVTAQGARTETVNNMYSTMNLEVIQVPYWTDSNNYAVVADPKMSPGLEIGFLDGNEEPEILQEVSGTGSDFTNDQLRYKLRHIYGGAITDFRPFVGNVVP